MRHPLLAAALAIAAASCSKPTATAEAPAPRAEAPAAATAVVPDGPGRVEEATFSSTALGVDKRYLVYLPAGYDPSGARRYPVIYMLHGLGGDETNWVEHGRLAEAADALKLQAIVVMPDGDAGFYANWATPVDHARCLGQKPVFSPEADPATYCVKTARYEDYIVRDLVAHVDATYRTIPERGARGIGGLSMGGFGALQLAMRHKDVFASAASHSGVDALLYAGPHPYVAGQAVIADDVKAWGKEVEPIGAHVRGIFGKDLATWQAHDPATLAASLSDGELAIYLDCGTEDVFQLHDGAQYLHDVLAARGVQHAWYLGPGKHTFEFWTQRIDDSLAFHAANLAPAAP
jgi:S-formylglutathione hydrolase FrmB